LFVGFVERLENLRKTEEGLIHDRRKGGVDFAATNERP